MKIFNLNKFRKDHNLTQQVVADWFGLPQSSISAMESGRQKVTQEHIAILREQIEFEPEDYMEEETKGVNVSGNSGRQIGNISGLSEDGLNKILSVIDRSTSQAIEAANKLNSKQEEHNKLLLKHFEEDKALRDENYQLRVQIAEMKMALAAKGITL